MIIHFFRNTYLYEKIVLKLIIFTLTNQPVQLSKKIQGLPMS